MAALTPKALPKQHVVLRKADDPAARLIDALTTHPLVGMAGWALGPFIVGRTPV